MVKLSGKYLVQKNKACKYFQVRKPNDTDKQFLERITHLQLQNHFIEQIVKIEGCENIKVLYLQQNLLKNLDNMDNFPNLTRLYLQRNFLVKLENLNVLRRLKKIYLGHNEIQVLEGMDQLTEMREIHLENQDLAVGDTMYFEPLTINNLGATLQVLNISNNYLTTIYGLKNLFSLRILNASDNYLSDLDEITAVIAEWSYLEDLNLTGNPVTKDKWYKDSIIYASDSLVTLDKGHIHPNTRAFIRKLVDQKRRLYAKEKTEAEKGTVEGGKKKILKFAENLDGTQREKPFDFKDPFPAQGPIYLHPPWKIRKNVNSIAPAKSLLLRSVWRQTGNVETTEEQT